MAAMLMLPCGHAPCKPQRAGLASCKRDKELVVVTGLTFETSSSTLTPDSDPKADGELAEVSDIGMLDPVKMANFGMTGT